MRSLPLFLLTLLHLRAPAMSDLTTLSQREVDPTPMSFSKNITENLNLTTTKQIALENNYKSNVPEKKFDTNNKTFKNMSINVTTSENLITQNIYNITNNPLSNYTLIKEILKLNTSKHFDKTASEPYKNIITNKPNRNYSENFILKSLSQTIEHVQNVNKTYQSVNKFVAIKNETLKSLGSVDMIVSSLNGEDGAKNVDLNFSKMLENNQNPTRTNRTALQIQGKTDAPMLNYIFDRYSTLNKHQHRNSRFGGPKFEFSDSNLTIVDTEADAQLDCVVSSLQDKLVSWVRRKGDDALEILTIGLQAYTADPRFSIDYLEPHTWRLLLRSAVPSDSGTYECQLSTHPPLISRHELVVYAPEVGILEAAVDKYYERNSTLELGCRVRHLTTSAVQWLHQSRMLNDDTQRGGISVKIEAVPGGADSTLQVARLTSSDAGKYTCSVRQGLQASVTVHVLNESLAELQQTSGAFVTSSTIPFHRFLITSLFHKMFSSHLWWTLTARAR